MTKGLLCPQRYVGRSSTTSLWRQNRKDVDMRAVVGTTSFLLPPLLPAFSLKQTLGESFLKFSGLGMGTLGLVSLPVPCCLTLPEPSSWVHTWPFHCQRKMKGSGSARGLGFFYNFCEQIFSLPLNLVPK